MLNFKALDNVYNKFNNDLIAEAQKCSDDIKVITDKFIQYNVGTGVNYLWQEESVGEYHTMKVDCGIYWDSCIKKIMLWVDTPSEATILAGDNARTRASVRPKLQNLINKAVDSVNRERETYLGHTEEEMKKKSLVNLMETHLALRDVMEMESEAQDTSYTVNQETGDYEDEVVDIRAELESSMSDEEYDEHIYREPVNGGPSIADEMLTNGNR